MLETEMDVVVPLDRFDDGARPRLTQ